jgi:thymidylate kinase
MTTAKSCLPIQTDFSSHMKPLMTAGDLVIAMIAELESRGLPSVYLRNYEKLPNEVGNDVDLLVPYGKRNAAADILEKAAGDHGWQKLGRAHFSPLAVYFANVNTAETLHLDLFDRLEWHFIEFADASKILARRAFNGLVHIPMVDDEIYLNLATRLIYQGKIREKHRQQVREFIRDKGDDSVRTSFTDHLGAAGAALAEGLAHEQWRASPALRRSLLRVAVRHHGIRRPWRVAVGAGRYGLRILRKIVKPPGHFIVLEGADGVGKSTVLEAILPWLSEWCAGRDPYDFHWKPVRLHSSSHRQNPPVDPRGKKPRSAPASIAYLAFHVLGFWWGWLFRIRPLLAKSHPVVGDRYSYDLFLDPKRFRLNLPGGLCCFASLLTPKPHLTLALLADPEVVHARKPELSVAEIYAYQNRWRSLANGQATMVSVSADGAPEDVILRIKRAIISSVIRENLQHKKSIFSVAQV